MDVSGQPIHYEQLCLRFEQYYYDVMINAQ